MAVPCLRSIALRVVFRPTVKTQLDVVRRLRVSATMPWRWRQHHDPVGGRLKLGAGGIDGLAGSGKEAGKRWA